MGLLQVVTEPLDLTDECHHYSQLSEVPWDIQKYWHQRYSIFDFYDYGIHLTDDAWFGVTPEPVAIKVAQQLAVMSAPDKTTVVDLFAGAGGNAIAFALSERWDRVIAIEKDAATLACAQYNADIYGVADAITWVLGDCFDFLAAAREQAERKPGAPAPADEDPALRIDPARTTLFASPPWGGVSYRDLEVFDLAQMQPYNLAQLHEACAPLSHTLYLPRTGDLRQIAALVPDGEKVEVVQYCMEGASKAMVAYFLDASDRSHGGPLAKQEALKKEEDGSGGGEGHGEEQKLPRDIKSLAEVQAFVTAVDNMIPEE